MIDIARAPFPVKVRELWLPRAINGVGLPSSRYDGHPLTLTGAKLGSTADGVHFTGANDSNINCGAIHNASAKLWISSRFKLDQDFSSASGADLRLSGKFVGGADYIRVYLDAANGALVLASIVGGVWHFLITVATSWNAGQWYNVIASMSDVAGMRLRIDGGVAVVNPAYVDAVPNGGDFVIGDSDDPGGGSGFEGVIADFVVGTDDLSVAEEADLSKGIPPADAVNFYPLDEGRGVTAYDRGSGGNNGTLDTTASWAFGECKHPVLSLDGINDFGQSSAGVDIGGALTLVWVGKMKSTYNSLAVLPAFLELRVNVNNIIHIYRDVTNVIRFRSLGSGIGNFVDYSTWPAIDDYQVWYLTITEAGVLSVFVNGSLVGSASGVDPRVGAATAYLGAVGWALVAYDVSKPLMVGLFDTAWSAKQVKAFSKWLNETLSLGVKI